MKTVLIIDPLHEKTLTICVGGYEIFCKMMDRLGGDTTERGGELALFCHIPAVGWYIWMEKPNLAHLVHELTHCTREMGNRMGYTNEPDHEYYAHAMEYYTREAIKKLKIKV